MTRTLEEHHKDCAAANNNFMCMCDCDLLENKEKAMTKPEEAAAELLPTKCICNPNGHSDWDHDFNCPGSPYYGKPNPQSRPSPDHAGLVRSVSETIRVFVAHNLDEAEAISADIFISNRDDQLADFICSRHFNAAALSNPSPSMPDREEIAKAIASVAGATWPQDANRYRAMADAAIAAQGVPLDREAIDVMCGNVELDGMTQADFREGLAKLEQAGGE